jgi:enolase-phosphatase E1
MPVNLSLDHISAVLLDIEGTTTPISFVYDVLFPFARSGVRDYLAQHLQQAEVQEALSQLRSEHLADLEQDLNPPPLSSGSSSETIDTTVAYVYWLMDRDRKSTGLKALQGRIWQHGYADGQLRSQVFPDVPPALQRWQEKRLNVSIFSSGSILAQQLLFAHTEAGDLTCFLDSYFDTTTGPKSAAESYRQIVSELNYPPGAVLFISDVLAELDAACAAGLATLLCIRPGNHPQSSGHTHPSAHSFAEII